MSTGGKRSALTIAVLELLDTPRTLEEIRAALGYPAAIVETLHNCRARGEVQNLRPGRNVEGLYVRTYRAGAVLAKTPRPQPTLNWQAGAELHTTWMRAMRAPRATDRRA